MFVYLEIVLKEVEWDLDLLSTPGKFEALNLAFVMVKVALMLQNVRRIILQKVINGSKNKSSITLTIYKIFREIK